jgi:hypothetical protein
MYVNERIVQLLMLAIAVVSLLIALIELLKG